MSKEPTPGPKLRKRTLSLAPQLTECEETVVERLRVPESAFSSQANKTLAGELKLRYFGGPSDQLGDLQLRVAKVLSALHYQEYIGASVCERFGDELHLSIAPPTEVTEPISHLWAVAFVLAVFSAGLIVAVTRW